MDSSFMHIQVVMSIEIWYKEVNTVDSPRIVHIWRKHTLTTTVSLLLLGYLTSFPKSAAQHKTINLRLFSEF